jgi:hypothetical protein
MDIEEAFNDMLGSLYAVDGPDLIHGVLAWESTVAAAAAMARKLGHPATVRGNAETPDHGRWMDVCGRIIAALNTMTGTAEQVRMEAEQRAADAEALREELMAQGAAGTGDQREASFAGAMEAERARLRALGEAKAAGDWEQAANDAAGAGVLLTTSKDRVLGPVVVAVADLGEDRVALDRGYHRA